MIYETSSANYTLRLEKQNCLIFIDLPPSRHRTHKCRLCCKMLYLSVIHAYTINLLRLGQHYCCCYLYKTNSKNNF